MLQPKHMYKSAKQRAKEDGEPMPNKFITIQCRNAIQTNYLAICATINKNNPFQDYLPPSIGPELPKPLAVTIPTMMADANTLSRRPCICDKVKPPTKLLHETAAPPTSTGRTRHLISADPVDFPMYPGVQALLRLPKNFTPNAIADGLDEEEILRDLIAQLDAWHFSVCPDNTRDFRAWLFDIKSACMKRMKRHTTTKLKDPFGPEDKKDVEQAIKDGLSIGITDKGSGFIAVCNHLPQVMLAEFMENPDRYKPSPLSQKQVARMHEKNFLKIYGVAQTVHSKSPMLSPTYKHHKDKKRKHEFKEYPIRPVTKYNGFGTQHQQQDLASILTILEKHHCFTPDRHVCTSSDDFLQSLPMTFETQTSSDIVGMFDNLDLEFAIYALNILLDELFEANPRSHIRLRRNGTAYWCKQRPDPMNDRHFPIQRIKALLKYLLLNDYVVAFDKVFKSISGCPMGAPSSGKICSLVAYFCERDILKAIRKRKPETIFRRYADDVWTTLSKQAMQIHLAGTYKAAGFTLEYEEPAGPTKELSFLEVSVHLGTRHEPYTTHYSKREVKFPHERTLPHKASAMSKMQQQCQLTALIRRKYHSTTHITHFVHNLCSIHKKHKEYTISEITKATFKVFERTTQPRYTIPDQRDLGRCIKHDRHVYDARLKYTFFLR